MDPLCSSLMTPLLQSRGDINHCSIHYSFVHLSEEVKAVRAEGWVCTLLRVKPFADTWTLLLCCPRLVWSCHTYSGCLQTGSLTSQQPVSTLISALLGDGLQLHYKRHKCWWIAYKSATETLMILGSCDSWMNTLETRWECYTLYSHTKEKKNVFFQCVLREVWLLGTNTAENATKSACNLCTFSEHLFLPHCLWHMCIPAHTRVRTHTHIHTPVSLASLLVKDFLEYRVIVVPWGFASRMMWFLSCRTTCAPIFTRIHTHKQARCRTNTHFTINLCFQWLMCVC